jgi:hypothetical protein
MVCRQHLVSAVLLLVVVVVVLVLLLLLMLVVVVVVVVVRLVRLVSLAAVPMLPALYHKFTVGHCAMSTCPFPRLDSCLFTAAGLLVITFPAAVVLVLVVQRRGWALTPY